MADEETLQDYDGEMESLIADIRKGIALLSPGNKKSKLTEAERSSKVAYINGRLQRAKQVIRSYKADLRSLNKSVAESYTQKVNTYKTTLDQLVIDLNFAQDNNALIGGATPKKKDLDSMTADEILDLGADTQNQSLESLTRAANTINDTREVGARTMEQLHNQTDQLRRVDEGISEVQSNLKLASKQLRAYVRRLATDKIIMAFMVLIVLGIIFVIIWTATHKKSSTSITDQLA